MMARVPITVMGYRCERCGHEWVPRDFDSEPRVCPKCKSAYWNRPRRSMMTYDDFSDKIRGTLEVAEGPLSWTEIRTKAALPQLFPNNQWVHRLEHDIRLRRERDHDGIIRWRLAAEEGEDDAEKTEAPKPTKSARRRGGREQGAVERS
jgi:DNA-directed RNA polymerase subunit RPC12/RpoP